jgi:DNA-binding transcriptional MerR regulator
MSDLPAIPDKLYFTIGEVGKLCELKPHVLRYWEQEFSQLSPTKRRGNRRYYQRKEVLLIRKIRTLLYSEGYTIEGARQQLATTTKASLEQEVQMQVKKALTELEKVVKQLEQA